MEGAEGDLMETDGGLEAEVMEGAEGDLREKDGGLGE